MQTMGSACTVAISEHTLARMVRATTDQAYTVKQLSKMLSIDYMEIYNFLNTKKGLFYFSRQKFDGLVWVRAVPDGHHLIKGKAKLKPYQKAHQADAHYSAIDTTKAVNDLPARCSWERKQAIHKVRRINGFGQTATGANGQRYFRFHSSFHEKQYNESLDLFSRYIEKINLLELYFEPLHDIFAASVTIPYATRFNNLPKQIKLRENFENAFRGGEAQYDIASFVTLTTDPKLFKNLWDANKYFQKNWNKLITALRKRLKKELPYVCVREFQNNGRVHFHIVLFGVHLPPTKKNAPWNNPISRTWQKYGQGEITDVKNLRVGSDGVMTWIHDKPADCRGESPMKYLKKYLLKAQYDETAQFQYWIYNARYYTYSRALHRTPKRRRYVSMYRFAGTIDREAGKFYKNPGVKLQKREYGLGRVLPPDSMELRTNQSPERSDIQELLQIIRNRSCNWKYK